MDVHRTFRMPDTLNSKSGLTKMGCIDLKSFDPLNDCCLLGGRDVEVKVKITSPQLNFVQLLLSAESRLFTKDQEVDSFIQQMVV